MQGLSMEKIDPWFRLVEIENQRYGLSQFETTKYPRVFTLYSPYLILSAL
jgi:hypothetical protein